MFKRTQRSDWRAKRQGVSSLFLNDSKNAARICYKEGMYTFKRYAQIHKTDVDALMYEVLTDFGLDDNCKKIYDLGDCKICVELSSDFKIMLTNMNTGKEVRSLPKKGSDSVLFAKANEDLKEMRDNVKEVSKICFEKLMENYLSGEATEVAVWNKRFNINPFMRLIAGRVVWEQNNKFFTMTENSLSDAEGNGFQLGSEPVCVAHSMDMNEKEQIKWQKWFSDRQLKQPFEQVWEHAYSEEEILPTRYKGSQVRFKYLMGKKKHGINATCYSTYLVEHNISLDECKIEYKIKHYSEETLSDYIVEFNLFSFENYTRKVNHIVNILDKVTVYERIKKDDVSIANILPSYSLAQITEFIKLAGEHNAVNVSAILLDYKNSHFEGFNPMDEFTLDW